MLFKKKLSWSNIPFDEMKKRSKLLVIDDDNFFYLDLFTNDGYSIEHWTDIDDLPKLETGYYDIILLDIQGVGLQQSSEQGFGILKHLKRKLPLQIIIAYSNADYSLKYQEFFSLANASLSKSADYVDFKSTVDDLLQTRFSMDYYLSGILQLVEQHIQDVHKFERIAVRALETGNTKRLEKFLARYVENKEITSSILSIVQIAITLASL